MCSHLSVDCVLLLLLLLLLSRTLEGAYIVEVGHNAYLPCSYTLPTSGNPVPVCWGKGPCPVFECSVTVLKTDERKVTSQLSNRYQLKGNLYKGDVSLTIRSVTLADSGTYCCRIQFPGLMNDKKINLELVIKSDAAVSDVQIGGVVGQPVTLPCTYSAAREGVTSMCWGRGACPSFRCANELIYTDGTHVTYQQIRRYKLLGDLSSGDVSLTIEHASESDSGLYCCRIEIPGWFNDIKITLKLDIEPARTTSAPTTARVSTTAPTTPASTKSPEPGNETCFRAQRPSSRPLRALCKAEVQSRVRDLTRIPNMAFTRFVILPLSPDNMHFWLVAFKSPQIGTLKSTAEERVRAEDNVYIIEDNIYIVN
ncbi:Hepatitis A virus cellular receptor 1 like protein [Tupaia chinensis]|uniref:Hepatitis A virus cellular receptor 1 like protein n=1 Tax=Tupaia chinensis TaxID=246437 RepID=L8YBG0_TUPCH|nr:Hepatitis A virus cellular receptor 1 like protein [Tupaia chinensis]